MPMMQTRRRFLGGVALAGAAGFLRPLRALGAEAPLETTAIRVVKNQGICYAPQYVAEELLRDGRLYRYSLCRYAADPRYRRRSRGAQSISAWTMRRNSSRDIDAGAAVTVIGGVMVGCVELFAREGIRSVADLKGKSVGVQATGSLPNILVVLMAAHVGLDPVKDIHWVTDPKVKPKELFIDGKIDAFLGFPPEPQELRARGIGHVIVNTAVDRPWSQYYCCMLGGNPELRPQPAGRDQARAARRPQSGGSLRHRPGERGAADRRSRVHPQLRLRAADLEREFPTTSGGSTTRGCDALLRASAARYGID